MSSSRRTEQLRKDMFAKRDALRTLWLAPTPDRDAILEAQKEMRILRDTLQDKMTAYRLEALNVLTPEQREKLQSAKPGRGFGPGRGMGPGACAGGNCPGGGPSACPGGTVRAAVPVLAATGNQ